MVEIVKALKNTSIYELPKAISFLYRKNEYTYDEEGDRVILNGIIPEFGFARNGEMRYFSIDFSDLEKALVEILRIAGIFGSFYINLRIKVYKDGKLFEELKFCPTTINIIADLLREQIQNLKEEKKCKTLNVK